MRCSLLIGAALALPGCGSGHTVLQAPAPPTPALPASVTLRERSSKESSVAHWLEELRQANPQAVAELEQRFDATLARANQDMAAAEVRRLLDEIVGPLTRAYVELRDRFEPAVRLRLLRLLNATQDPRAEPAYQVALDAFVARAPTDTDETDLPWALRAIAQQHLTGYSSQLLRTFQAFHASTLVGYRTSRDLRDALFAAPDRAWIPVLQQLLSTPVVIPLGGTDRVRIPPYVDQLFLQTLSAQLLGVMRDDSSIEPLMKLLLDPSKVDLHTTALMSLIRFGHATVTAATRLLQGESTELQQFHQDRLGNALTRMADTEAESRVRVAALILGTQGRLESAPPLLGALGSVKEPVTRAVLARELAHIPRAPGALSAFKATLAQLSPHTLMPQQQGSAAAMLAEAALAFFDPSLAPMLAERAKHLPARSPESHEARRALFESALLLATASLFVSIDFWALARSLGADADLVKVEQAEELLRCCDTRVVCHLATARESWGQKPFVVKKAIYMIGSFGAESDRDALLELLTANEDGPNEYAAASAIDHLTPRASPALLANVRAGLALRERGPYAAAGPLRRLMYRIEVR
jgi:hypothetical protein